jgi:hypothetical protein
MIVSCGLSGASHQACRATKRQSHTYGIGGRFSNKIRTTWPLTIWKSRNEKDSSTGNLSNMNQIQEKQDYDVDDKPTTQYIEYMDRLAGLNESRQLEYPEALKNMLEPRWELCWRD